MHLAYAPGIEVPRQVEAKQATVPRAGSTGSKVCRICTGQLWRRSGSGSLTSGLCARELQLS